MLQCSQHSQLQHICAQHAGPRSLDTVWKAHAATSALRSWHNSHTPLQPHLHMDTLLFAHVLLHCCLCCLWTLCFLCLPRPVPLSPPSPAGSLAGPGLQTTAVRDGAESTSPPGPCLRTVPPTLQSCCSQPPILHMQFHLAASPDRCSGLRGAHASCPLAPRDRSDSI